MLAPFLLRLLVLALFLSLTQSTLARPSKLATTASPLGRSSGIVELTPNTQRNVEIRDSKTRFVWSGDNTFLFYASFKGFHFLSPSDGRYLLRYQSDNSFLSLRAFTSDYKILDATKDLSFSIPPNTKTVTMSLSKGQDIWIVLGASQTSKPINIHIGIYTDPDQTLNTGKSRDYSTIRPGQTEFEFPSLGPDDDFVPILFFKPLQKHLDKWITISAISQKANPYILILDENGNIIESDFRRVEKRGSSEVVLGPSLGWFSFSVQASDLRALRGDSAKVLISFEETPYDPRYSFFGLTAFYLGNPLIGLLAAAILGALTGYFFYRKGLNTKRIYLEVEEDRLVVNTDNTTTPLLYDLTKNPIHCASLCTLVVRREGAGHLQAQDIITPLTITLEKVTKIISFQISKKRGTWTIPQEERAEGNQLRVDFTSLVDGDYATIAILCEQKEPTDIEASLNGDVKDAAIRTRRYKIRGIPMSVAVAYIILAGFGVALGIGTAELTDLLGLKGYTATVVYGIVLLATISAIIVTRDFWLRVPTRVGNFLNPARRR